MPSETEQSSDFVALLEYLRRARGFDFSGYKRTSLTRRLKVRMNAVGVQSSADYIDYLEVHPEEFSQLFNTILINVTAFFRDEESWEFLASTVIPLILERKNGNEQIRIWSAGCSSGEEAYTIMMIFAEKLGIEAVRDRVKVYATDLDEDALQQARQATYASRAMAGVPDEMVAKYFKPHGSSYVFNGDLRRGVIFGRHDLMNDAPISRCDLLVCRNCLMYFNAEIQARILSRFNFAINSNGFLMLGKAEMLFTHTNLFLPVDLQRRIFSKVPRININDRVQLISPSAIATDLDETSDTQVRNWQAVFDATPGAQIVLNRSGVIVLISEGARALFRLTNRDVGRLLQDVQVSYRPLELRSLIDQAYRDVKSLLVQQVPLSAPHLRAGEMSYFDVQVSPIIDEESALLGAVVTFQEATRYKALQDDIQQATRDLVATQEELQSVNEEFETTSEELQSTIEELETTNEELQSTNEELETMNEELQSTNEELQAINDELRVRSNELNNVNKFMNALLYSVESAVIMLDKDLIIRLWNRRAEEMWGLRSDEAIGRHLLNVDIGLPVSELTQTIRTVMAEEASSDMVEISAVGRTGKPIKCRITISPMAEKGSANVGIILLIEQT